VLYAILGLGVLITARSLGLEELVTYRPGGQRVVGLQGRGVSAFQSGNAILVMSLLSGFFQGVVSLIQGSSAWTEDLVLLLVTAISGIATFNIPQGNAWRRIYSSAAVVLGALLLLTFTQEWLQQLSSGERIEVLCVVGGLLLLISGYVGRFREPDGETHEVVSAQLLMGSLFASLPILAAVVYHRCWGDGISLIDELAVITVGTLMLVTGFSWQTRSPVIVGGGCLTLYLIMLVTDLARRAEEMMGVAVFMTIIGGLVFVIGIVLSSYREWFLLLPEKLSRREGIFRVISWR